MSSAEISLLFVVLLSCPRIRGGCFTFALSAESLRLANMTCPFYARCLRAHHFQQPLLTQAYLQSVNKSAKLSLCPTPECPCTGITSSWNTKYFWGVDRTCSVCDSTWTICKECTLRSHYCTQKAKQTHHCTRHTVPIFLRMPSRKPTLRLDFFSVKKGLMRLFNNQPIL